MSEQAPPAPATTVEVLAAHTFVHGVEGDGWTERRQEHYCCSCGQMAYAWWVQEDPVHTGRREFTEDREVYLAAHAEHLAAAVGELLEAVWDAGRAVGEEAALKPTRIDLAGDKNPYRGQPAVPLPAVRYPVGAH